MLNQFVVFKAASLPVLPLTKVYSKVTKMMKTESKTERERRSLLKELFISLVERIVIDKQFPSSPNVPTKGMRAPSMTRLQVSGIMAVLLERNSSHPESFLISTRFIFYWLTF